MALIKCPECGKDVSDYAGVCIHCGYPLKKELSQPPDSLNDKTKRVGKWSLISKRNKLIILIPALAVIILVCAFFIYKYFFMHTSVESLPISIGINGQPAQVSYSGYVKHKMPVGDGEYIVSIDPDTTYTVHGSYSSDTGLCGFAENLPIDIYCCGAILHGYYTGNVIDMEFAPDAPCTVCNSNGDVFLRVPFPLTIFCAEKSLM